MKQKVRYDSVVNVVGSIPDYAAMIDFIIKEKEGEKEGTNFRFRTEKATSRFKKAVHDGFLSFSSKEHEKLFMSMMKSEKCRLEEKLISLFWQLVYCNSLFRDTTDNVYLRFLYSGRTGIASSDIEGYLKYLKSECPEEIPFGDQTLKTISSKYLTILKKIGLAEGSIRKKIKAPHISSDLFIYLIQFSLLAYPEENSLDNPMFRFSFLDKQSIINRLKSIEYIPLWDITQIGSEITITLKHE